MFRQLLGMSQIYEYVTRSELLQVPLQYIQVNYVARKAWTALRPSVGTMRLLVEKCGSDFSAAEEGGGGEAP